MFVLRRPRLVARVRGDTAGNIPMTDRDRERPAPAGVLGMLVGDPGPWRGGWDAVLVLGSGALGRREGILAARR